MEPYKTKKLIENIYRLAKLKGIMIKDIETAGHVSSGYLARINKDSQSVPSIEFVYLVSKKLSVTVNELIESDFEQADRSETLIENFLNKLILQTSQQSIEWEEYTEEWLENNYRRLSLFQTGFINNKSLKNNPRWMHSFGENYNFSKKTFSAFLSFPNTTNKEIYIVSICSPDQTSAYEVWLVDGSNRSLIAYTGNGKTSDDLINGLYSKIEQYIQKQAPSPSVLSYLEDYLED